MYLLYADESGDLTNKSDTAFVVGAVAVHEDAIRPLAGDMQGTLRRYVGNRDAAELELHGSPLRAGKGPWQRYPVGKRHALYKEMLNKLGSWSHEPSGSRIEAFVYIIDRECSQSPTETTYGELLYAVDEMLRDRRRAGDGHNAVLIADESRYEKTLQAWVHLRRQQQSHPQQDRRRLYAIAETPFFIGSHQTRLMQLADLVAHAFYRAFQADDWEFAQVVMDAVDPGRIVHFAANTPCSCPTCSTV